MNNTQTPLYDSYFDDRIPDFEITAGGKKFDIRFDSDIGLIFAWVKIDGEEIGHFQLSHENDNSIIETEYSEFDFGDNEELEGIVYPELRDHVVDYSNEAFSSKPDFEDVLKEFEPDLSFVMTARPGYYAAILGYDEIIGSYEYDSKYSGSSERAEEIYEDIKEKLAERAAKLDEERFDKALEELGLNKTTFADKIGVSRVTVSRNTNGREPIPEVYWLALKGLKANSVEGYVYPNDEEIFIFQKHTNGDVDYWYGDKADIISRISEKYRDEDKYWCLTGKELLEEYEDDDEIIELVKNHGLLTTYYKGNEHSDNPDWGIEFIDEFEDYLELNEHDLSYQIICTETELKQMIRSGENFVGSDFESFKYEIKELLFV